MLTLWLRRLHTLERRLWLGFSRTDLVLDIGSGHRPHPRADVLCDRYLADDLERGGPLVADRPLIAGDLTALPFKDKSVDFIVCQHVLEHVDDPAAALEELMRVGRAGYIETPAPLWEKLAGRSYHHWLVEREGNRLVCTAKPAFIPYRDLLPRFEAFSRSGHGWHLLTLEHFDAFYTTLLWRDRIEYEVRPGVSAGEPGHSAEPLGTSDPTGGFREPLVSVVRPMVMRLIRWLLAPRRHVDLSAIIACPRCHGGLATRDDWLECTACALRYPVRGGVPILLRDLAVGTVAPEPTRQETRRAAGEG